MTIIHLSRRIKMPRHIKDKVEQILINHPNTRNSDMVLLAMYFIRYYDIDSLSRLSTMPDIPSCESITRVRRKFQSEGQYLADVDVEEGRGVEEIRYRNYYRE